MEDIKEKVDKDIEPYLLEKRKEFIWALKTQQYSDAQIGRIFNLTRARIGVIVREMPKNYQSPWIKRV
ncbi:MAG: hypothetical protein Tp172MES00d2C118482111_30 [Prokaryotic dsDNA virus sp.]|nr:MAG: hypothetical protein Tp172MES00d2C118482111_30 [Prokaryotic dsDNA virus sp.]|tara:strand:- start:1160 stop:1363 length:204 start_codon:yes stop_codon:yes gene_type:complete